MSIRISDLNYNCFQIELIRQSILTVDPQFVPQEGPCAEDDDSPSRDDDLLTSAISHFTKLIKGSQRLKQRISSFSGPERCVLEDFERRKRSQTSIDYDDSIALVLGLFKSHPDILRQYSARYQYILVDEFQVSFVIVFQLKSLTETSQDVSESQMELVKLLASSTDSSTCSITVCGDQHQSIYGFLDNGESLLRTHVRKGKSNFDQFLAYWPQSNIVKLQRNYRSTGHLVRAASALIAKNGENETSCSCETPNSDGQKIVVFSSSCEEKEVQVHRSTNKFISNIGG